MFDLYVLGDINADVTTGLAAFPAEGDDSEITHLQWCSGGAAANSATAFALLGGRVALLGRVGGDPAATVALRAASNAGVDLALVQHDPITATGICIAAISPDGQRTFLSFRGANVQLNSADWTTEMVGSARALHVCAHALLEGAQQQATCRAIELAHANGMVVSLDLCAPAIRRQPALIAALLPSISLLFMNERELELLLPNMRIDLALSQLIDSGVTQVALKRGGQGCTVATRSGLLELGAFPIEASDTNGCGDAFAAGFVWGYLRGAPLVGCAALGNLLGGLTASRTGAADALPTLHELGTALNQYPQWVGSRIAKTYLL